MLAVTNECPFPGPGPSFSLLKYVAYSEIHYNEITAITNRFSFPVTHNFTKNHFSIAKIEIPTERTA